MAPPLSIVVVEDHDLLREATVIALQNAGHHAVGVVAAEDLEDLPQALAADIYVADLNLPGEDGISLAKRLRAVQPNVGIIMATARVEGTQKAEGYESGADIYLTKPVSQEELLAAVGSIARRIRAFPSNQASPILDMHTMRLECEGSGVALSFVECQLLAAFSKAPNSTLERFQVASLLKISLERLQETSSLEVRVSHLRRKLEQIGFPEAIRSIRGVGYRLVIEVTLRGTG